MSLILIRAFLWAACLLLLAAGAATDLRDRIIPNEAVILIAIGGFALGLISRSGSAWISLLASVVLFGALWTLVYRDFLGGGDAKLIAAVTLLVPPDRIGLLLMEIALAGGVLSVAYLAAYGVLRRTPVSQCGALSAACPTSGFDRFLISERARIVTGQSVPYALAVLGGVCIYVASECYRCLFATSCSL
jgi:prepilin peptidase CpaA